MPRVEISRRQWLKSAAALTVVSATAVHETRRSFAEDGEPTGILAIGSRRELFVDDFLIAKHTGTRLKMHQPVPRDVVLVCDAPWEGNTSAYYTLFADGDLFRMYYRGAHFDEAAKKSAHPECACYAESRDGLRWEKPQLGLIEFAGSKENNIIWMGEAGTHNFTPFKDENPACLPTAKYKALAGGAKGLKAYQSPDGVRWSLMREEPVITNGGFDSQNLAFWSPEQKRYVDFHRKVRDRARDIMTATSTDFLNWTEPEFLDYGDAPREDLYTNAIGPYFRAPHLLLGFPTRYQPKSQQVEPILMTSRDGRRFHRWPDPLIPITAPKDRDGNRSNYMTRGLLQLPGQDRELSVYATEAYYAGPGSRVRRFTFRTDGFVSLHAGAAGGEMLTKPFTFSGQQLTLNYAVAGGGRLQMEIQDSAGKPLTGFALSDSVPLIGDEIAAAVKWTTGADVSALAGKPIRLRFALANADVYALRFTA